MQACVARIQTAAFGRPFSLPQSAPCSMHGANSNDRLLNLSANAGTIHGLAQNGAFLVMATPSTSIAFMFPGQGSQSVGMLADLAQAHPEVRTTFEEASDGAGVDLWALSQQGPEASLNRTENTQPALLASGVAVWRVWATMGGAQPSKLAGHSLGEYTALVAAGVLSLHDAAGLVTERGRLMQAAVPLGTGGMAAVIGGDEERIAQICAEEAEDQVVAPANYNSPGQVVIAGNVEAVDRVLARLAEAGVKKAVKLAMSVPSHCELMRDAADQLAQRMDGMVWSSPELPVVQNVDARVHQDVASIREALRKQLFMPVRWSGCVQALAAEGITDLAECGPGKVLTGLVRRIDRGLSGHALGTPDAIEAARAAWA